MTFYDILGVPLDASQDEIRAAYRVLARIHHPDSLPADTDVPIISQAEEISKALNAAYHTLSDPARRRAYTQVMYTRLDPARQYTFRPQKTADRRAPSPRERADANRSHAATAGSILSEIKQTRTELKNILSQQHVHRRNFWMSAGFTSLLVYILIALGLQFFPSPDDFLPILVFFIGSELISQAVMMHFGGLKIERFPFFGSPVTFSITVFLGTMFSSASISQQGIQFARPSGLYFGMVMSLSLLVHLFLVTRMGKRQDAVFAAEIRRLDEHLQRLEQQLLDLKEKVRHSS